MLIDQPGNRLDTCDRSGEWLTGGRVLLYGGATLALSVIMLCTWAWVTHGFIANTTARPGVDFSVFWSASYAVLHGIAATIYDYSLFSRLEHGLFGHYLRGGFLPYLYPPTTLVLLAPLALLPYSLSFALFMGGSLVLYTRSIAAVSRLAGHLPNPKLAAWVVLAFPGVFVTATVGQNSLLTAGLAVLAVRWIDRNPWLAGVLVGMLAIKPQFGVLFPLVLLGIGAWRVIASAAATTTILVASGVALCGTRSLLGFQNGMSMVREILVETFPNYWYRSPSSFAALRLSGYSLPVAYAAQACVGLVAAAAAYCVWRKTRDVRMRAAVLAVSTLLCQPYLWHYELAWLGVSLFCLVASGIERGWLRGEQSVVIVAWCLPAYEYLCPMTLMLQVGPFVLLALLYVLVRRVRVMKESGDGHD